MQSHVINQTAVMKSHNTRKDITTSTHSTSTYRIVALLFWFGSDIVGARQDDDSAVLSTLFFAIKRLIFTMCFIAMLLTTNL